MKMRELKLGVLDGLQDGYGMEAIRAILPQPAQEAPETAEEPDEDDQKMKGVEAFFASRGGHCG